MAHDPEENDRLQKQELLQQPCLPIHFLDGGRWVVGQGHTIPGKAALKGLYKILESDEELAAWIYAQVQSYPDARVVLKAVVHKLAQVSQPHVEVLRDSGVLQFLPLSFRFATLHPVQSPWENPDRIDWHLSALEDASTPAG